MSSNAVLEIAGKLRDRSDFAMWSDQLRIALDSIDLSYWAILTGENKPAFDHVHTVPTHEQARVQMEREANAQMHADVSTSADVPTPSSAEIDAWINANFTEPNKEFADWTAKSAKILALLLPVVPVPTAMLLRLCGCASNAWLTLNTLYRGVPRYDYVEKVRAWNNCVYEPGQDHHDFIDRWRTALGEVQNSLDEPLPGKFIYATFLTAVRNNPSCVDWVESRKSDSATYPVVELAITDFIAYEEGGK